MTTRNARHHPPQRGNRTYQQALQDAVFHLLNVARSFDEADDLSRTPRGRHRAQEFARRARNLSKSAEHQVRTIRGES